MSEEIKDSKTPEVPTEETKEIKVGIRSIKFITDNDSIGQSFKFRLNGEDIYINILRFQTMNLKQQSISSLK